MTDAGGTGDAELTLRTRALEAVFAGISRSRMAGLPVMNTALQVEAVGFGLEPARPRDDEQHRPAPRDATGILVTPWFMNLVWLPLARRDTPALIGATRVRNIGHEQFAFTGAHEDGLGSFEACSMFSPMFEFATQADAIATASALLAQLRRRVDALPDARSDSALATPARRAFLLGRAGMREHAP
ncbi:[NiFe]-hydrogenase assembly chaperone HybE [Variovorax sp. M-6]|uniref:[NiFe]-hydrogenase assembly chaperone HybE n=1 Tax=Variovorax sp. M-6 TaxID=3233041 RepID=UPI003F9BFA31